MRPKGDENSRGPSGLKVNAQDVRIYMTRQRGTETQAGVEWIRLEKIQRNQRT